MKEARQRFNDRHFDILWQLPWWSLTAIMTSCDAIITSCDTYLIQNYLDGRNMPPYITNEYQMWNRCLPLNFKIKKAFLEVRGAFVLVFNIIMVGMSVAHFYPPLPLSPPLSPPPPSPSSLSSFPFSSSCISSHHLASKINWQCQYIDIHC